MSSYPEDIKHHKQVTKFAKKFENLDLNHKPWEEGEEVP